MGLFEDVGRAINDAVNSVTQETSRFVSNVQRELSNAGRGDIGAMIGKTGTSIYRTVKTPVEVASDLARGDIQNAKSNLAMGVGGAMNLNSGIIGRLAQTDEGQRFLSDKNVDRYSAGLSGDYAGTVRAANDLEYSGSTSQENIDDTLRFGTKVAVIGAAAAGYSAYQSAASVGGSAVPSYLSGAGTAASYGKDAALVYGAGSALIKGDVKGAVNAAGQISGDYTDWLPEFPDAPDWFPDLSGIWDSITGGGATTGGTTETNPWSIGGKADSGVSAPQAAGVSILTLALVVGAVYMIKKGK